MNISILHSLKIMGKGKKQIIMLDDMRLKGVKEYEIKSSVKGTELLLTIKVNELELSIDHCID